MTTLTCLPQGALAGREVQLTVNGTPSENSTGLNGSAGRERCTRARQYGLAGLGIRVPWLARVPATARTVQTARGMASEAGFAVRALAATATGRGIQYTLPGASRLAVTNGEGVHGRRYDLLFGHELETFPPDIVFTYGGSRDDRRRHRRARWISSAACWTNRGRRCFVAGNIRRVTVVSGCVKALPRMPGYYRSPGIESFFVNAHPGQEADPKKVPGFAPPRF